MKTDIQPPVAKLVVDDEQDDGHDDAEQAEDEERDVEAGADRLQLGHQDGPVLRGLAPGPENQLFA